MTTKNLDITTLAGRFVRERGQYYLDATDKWVEVRDWLQSQGVDNMDFTDAVAEMVLEMLVLAETTE